MCILMYNKHVYNCVVRPHVNIFGHMLYSRPVALGVFTGGWEVLGYFKPKSEFFGRFLSDLKPFLPLVFGLDAVS